MAKKNYCGVECDEIISEYDNSGCGRILGYLFLIDEGKIVAYGSEFFREGGISGSIKDVDFKTRLASQLEWTRVNRPKLYEAVSRYIQDDEVSKSPDEEWDNKDYQYEFEYLVIKKGEPLNQRGFRDHKEYIAKYPDPFCIHEIRDYAVFYRGCLYVATWNPFGTDEDFIELWPMVTHSKKPINVRRKHVFVVDSRYKDGATYDNIDLHEIVGSINKDIEKLEGASWSEIVDHCMPSEDDVE